MKLHDKLIGAIDAVVLAMSAAMTIALVFVLLSPPADRDGLAEGYSVTIEQLPI